MEIKKKVIQKAKDLASIKQHIRDSLLGLDRELKELEGEHNETGRKLKKQLKIDIFKRSVEYLESHEVTLIPKDRDNVESQNAKKNHQEEKT